MIEIGNVVFLQIPIGSGFIRHWYQVESVAPPCLRCLGASSSKQLKITDAFGTAGAIIQVRDLNNFIKS